MPGDRRHPRDPPRRLDDFELVREIGRGGMGVVYEARQVSLDRRVALKFLTAESYGDPRLRARFAREARTAASLSHPGVCTIHEVGEVRPGDVTTTGDIPALAPGTPFIAMELIEGQSLDRVLAQSGPLPVDRLLHLALQVAEALAAAHTQGIVHRDLKPGNLMVMAGDRVKILDFGLAKPLDPAGSDAEVTAGETRSDVLTREGHVLGTVAYMSPEQAMGKPVDRGSDLFSFGIMLYEMAAGRRPFQGESSTSTLAKILETEPRPLDEVRTGLPDGLPAIIDRCLRKRPEDRFREAGELLGALNGLAQSPGTGKPHVAPTASGAGAWRRRMPWMLAAIVAVVAVLVAVRELRVEPLEGVASAADELAARTAIAVLPMENLGPAEHEYFAAGMTEEITSRLVAVPDLDVISQSSASHYANTTKTTKRIGEELGCAYLIQGSVRWAGGLGEGARVRITTKLIRISDDKQLWTEAYDAVVDDIFEVQSQIARKAVDELGIVLGEPIGGATVAKPTDDPAAYEAYLRGLYDLEHGGGRADAIRSFEDAVERDADFALAHAALAEARSWAHFLGQQTSDEQREAAKRALDRAVALAPQAPEVDRARGVYLYHQREYSGALAAFERAETGMPSSTEVLLYKGYVLRRQGRWEEALAAFRRGARLSPLVPDFHAVAAETLARLRRFAESLEAYDHALALSPDETAIAGRKAAVLVLATGDLEAARRTLAENSEGDRPQSIALLAYQLDLYAGDYRRAIDGLEAVPGDWLRVNVSILPKSLLEGRARELLQEPELARAAYASAAQMLEAELVESPDEPRLHAALGIALAGLGEKSRAVNEGRLAVQTLPVSKDTLIGPYLLTDLAQIYAKVGEAEAAIDQLERLLSIPSNLSVPVMELDPAWKPLRNHPRFQRLLRATQ